MATRKPPHVLVRTAEQVRALAGPLPHRITAVMERLGPCTVREVAEAIGEKPETLYYHVRRLHRLGLLCERGQRRSGSNTQAVYELPGRELVFDHRQSTPTFLAAAGETDIKEKLKKGGVKAIGRTYKVHLDRSTFPNLE